MGRFVLILLVIMLGGLMITDLLLRHDAAHLLRAAKPESSARQDFAPPPDENPSAPTGRELEMGRRAELQLADPKARAAIREQLSLLGASIYLDSLLAGSDSVLRRWPEAPDRPLAVAILAPAPDERGLDLSEDVHRALESWTALGLGFRFATRTDSSGADIDVHWVDRLERNRTGQTDLRSDQLGAVHHARVLLALRGPDGQLLSEPVRRTVALHEIGHALGLPHSSDPSDVMFPSSRQSAPSPRDRQTMQQLYALPFGSIREQGPRPPSGH